MPGLTLNDFGKTSQYGVLTPTAYLLSGGHGALQNRYEVFRGNLGGNPCP